MDDITGLVAEIRAFRPFLPAKEFETSLRFYKAIGFHPYPLGENLAELLCLRHATHCETHAESRICLQVAPSFDCIPAIKTQFCRRLPLWIFTARRGVDVWVDRVLRTVPVGQGLIVFAATAQIWIS